MKLFNRFSFSLLGVLVLLLTMASLSPPAHAQVVLFSPVQGDLQFPGLQPGVIGSGVNPVAALPLQVDTGTRTATASSGAATLNKASGTITSESLVTATGAIYTLTVTDSTIAAADIVQASVNLGTSTQGTPDVTTIAPAAGSLVIKVKNIDATNAFNGTIKVGFVDLK
jgi:hypothetical protein